MLTTFPRLIGTNEQHTSIETESVRYVYQPIEDLYVVLLTTKQSNILQDIEMLHLFSRLVTEYCNGTSEREVSRNAFQLIFAFDEAISLGYPETKDIGEINQILEMDSHEERVQEEIARNKELEAKAELKRKMKMMEQQKKEQQRAMRQGFSSSDSYGGSGYGAVSSNQSPINGSVNQSGAVQPLPEQVNQYNYNQQSKNGPSKGLKLGKN